MAAEPAPKMWIVTTACAVCMIVGPSQIGFATVGLFSIPMSKEFGWSAAQFFGGVSLSVLFGAAAVPLVGQAVDRWGLRPVLLPGIVLYGLGIAGLSRLTGSMAQYLALMVFITVIGMLHSPMLYSRAVVQVADRRRGLALAVVNSGATVGAILIPLICSALILSIGWRGAQVALGLAVIFIAFPVAFLFLGRKPDLSPVAARSKAGGAPNPLLGDRTFWLLAIGFFLTAIGPHALLAHAAGVAVARHLPFTLGAAAVAASGVGAAVARLAAGYLLDRVRTPQVGQIWFGLVLAGLALACFGGGAWSLIAGTALIGAAVGAEGELIPYFVSRFFPQELFGRVYGVIFAGFLLGVAGGPFAFAVMFDATKSHMTGFVVMIVAAAGACLCLAGVGPYRFAPAAPKAEPEPALSTAAAE